MPQDGGDSAQPVEITRLDEARARRFLSELAARPFVTALVQEGVVRVYVKGMSKEEAARIMQSIADELGE